jgi:hypothetical protein
MILKPAFATLSVFLLLLLGCLGNMRIAGTVTDTGNPVITGRIVDTLGNSVSGVQAFALPDGYDPVAGRAVPDSMMDTTDENGRFVIRVPMSGIYNVQALHLMLRTRLLIQDINVAGDSTALPVDTVRKPARIKVVVPAGLDTTNGYFFIPGTTTYSQLNDNNGSVVLDSVPADVNLSVYYAVRTSMVKPLVIADSVIVLPGGNATIAYSGWKYSKKLFLNTTASGANIAGNVINFPVLVRLSQSSFNFTEAKSGGEDVRFTKSDGSPLSYEIERWDASLSLAELWVKVDTVYGNDSTHFIIMYWGASTGSVTSTSNSAAVFDTINGFEGVWHLGEAGDAPALDATANHYDGTPMGMSAASAIDGIDGKARNFDGVTNFIRMNNTASSKLSFKENGVYSISAWAYIDTIDTNFHMIAGKGNLDYYLKLKPPAMGGTIEFVEYENNGGWYYSSGSPFKQTKTWIYISGVRDGSIQRIYINGQLVKDGGTLVSKALPRDESEDFAIGRYVNEAVNPNPPEGFCNFKGIIDEVRASNVANSADWIKLCYMNQKQQNALVVFK